MDQGALHGCGGAQVSTYDAQVGGQATGGDLLTGQDLDELLLPSRGVASRDDHDLQPVLVADGSSHGGDGFGLVVLDGDQGFAPGLNDVAENAHTEEDGFGPLPHQHVIGGDVGLALDAIDEMGRASGREESEM